MKLGIAYFFNFMDIRYSATTKRKSLIVMHRDRRLLRCVHILKCVLLLVRLQNHRVEFRVKFRVT